MKKILITSQAMEIGGAERALLGLLESIDTSEYSVDLFLMRHQGELLNLVPSSINLLPQNDKYSSLGIPMVDVIKKMDLSIAFGRLNARFKAKKHFKKAGIIDGGAIEDLYSHKYTIKYLPKFTYETYDVAISFLTPHYIVSEKVNAKTKIAWIHTDYSSVEIDTESELEMWSKFDIIVSISDDVTTAFLKAFPSLKDKIVLIENIVSKKFIDSQSELLNVSSEMPPNEIRLLSIGRFCEAKNFDNVPEMASIIKSKGINFKWYLIGYGQDEELIKSKIKEFNMQDTVVILGKKENPYPYIKACDIYVQPSRYEGKAVTVHEALILSKPIVIANYATAKSQLNDGVDGIILPLDNMGFANGLVELMLNKEKQQQLVDNMKNINYSNEDEIKKLYKIIGE